MMVHNNHGYYDGSQTIIMYPRSPGMYTAIDS